MPYGGTVQPTQELGGPSLPGLYSTPQREYWLCAGQIDAGGVGTAATFKLWAATATFASIDSRTAAGLWVLHWEAKSAATTLQLNLGVTIAEEVDPGQGAGNSLEINAVGGTQFVAGAPALQDVGANRSPRAQVNASVPGASIAALIPWPSQTNTLTPRLGGPIAPFYVPPGRAFVLQDTFTLNDDIEFAVAWVEAEEAPIFPVTTGAS